MKPNYFFSERPHYHKNWFESEMLLIKYLNEYVSKAWIYDDLGVPIGTAGDVEMLHPDRKAKLQHILR